MQDVDFHKIKSMKGLQVMAARANCQPTNIKCCADCTGF